MTMTRRRPLTVTLSKRKSKSSERSLKFPLSFVVALSLIVAPILPPSLPSQSAFVAAMSAPTAFSPRHTRDMLPSRPTPSAPIHPSDSAPPFALDARRLIGTTRLGGVDVSPTGTHAVFEVRQYDSDRKKFDAQLWLADLTDADAGGGGKEDPNGHLRQLTAGSQHGWTEASAPNFSPCGGYVAFLSDRPTGSSGGGGGKGKSAVWIIPVDGPGEARLLREFPVSVADLDWSHGGGVGSGGGITVSASVYVDGKDGKGDSMKITADRDQELEDADGKLGGLNAVLFKRLPIREWDRWLDAKMAHPFYCKVDRNDATGVYTCATTATTEAETATATATTNDLLHGVPTAVPSGAFGGSDDWSISSLGHVAFSARPPLAHDEAWTTNRHIYLTEKKPNGQNTAPPSPPSPDGTDEHLLGKCLTPDNPGFDTNPTFSPDGTRLAWLTMAGASYESDAVGIQVYDVPSGVTSTLLQAEEDWDHSPNSLTWSKDGTRLYFTADVRARQVLAYVDSTRGAEGGGGITVLGGDHTGSTSFHGEFGDGRLLTTVQSITAPPELFVRDGDGTVVRQLTHFNTDRIADTALGRPGEIVFKGEKDEDVQAWLVRPAGFSEEEEEKAKGQKGGDGGKRKERPQRSQGDRRSQGATLKALSDAKHDTDKFVEGEVVSMLDFGAFVRFDASQLAESVTGELDGLVHISALMAGRCNSVADVVSVGQKVQIRVKGVDVEGGKTALSMITDEQEQENRPARGGGGGNRGRQMFSENEMGAKDWKESLEKFQTEQAVTFTNAPMVQEKRK